MVLFSRNPAALLPRSNAFYPVPAFAGGDRHPPKPDALPESGGTGKQAEKSNESGRFLPVPDPRPLKPVGQNPPINKAENPELAEKLRYQMNHAGIGKKGGRASYRRSRDSFDRLDKMLARLLHVDHALNHPGYLGVYSPRGVDKFLLAWRPEYADVIEAKLPLLRAALPDFYIEVILKEPVVHKVDHFA